MNQYSFPVLDEGDMVAFLADINFPFQPQWRKPTTPMVSEIYANLVEIVIGIDKERLSHPQFDLMEKNRIHQDVYSRGIPEMGMLMMIFQLMDACCVFNFSLRDITHPTWGRLRTIISGVINFVRFQHEFFNTVDNAVELTCELQDKRAQLQDSVNKLTQQYQQHVGSPEVQLLKQLQLQQKALEEELMMKRQQREVLENDFRTQSSKLKAINDKINSLDETIKNLKYEVNLLQSRDMTGLLHDVENLKAKVEVHEQNVNIQERDLVIIRMKQDVCLFVCFFSVCPLVSFCLLPFVIQSFTICSSSYLLYYIISHIYNICIQLLLLSSFLSP